MLVCFLQGPHSHVRDHEELRTHLWEALVARSLQDRVPHFRQYEAARAADRGQPSSPGYHQFSCLLGLFPTYLNVCGKSLLWFEDTVHNCQFWKWDLHQVMFPFRKLSGWQQHVTTRFTPSVMCSPSSMSPSVKSCWPTFSHSYSGVWGKVGVHTHTRKNDLLENVLTFLKLQLCTVGKWSPYCRLVSSVCLQGLEVLIRVAQPQKWEKACVHRCPHSYR